MSRRPSFDVVLASAVGVGHEISSPTKGWASPPSTSRVCDPFFTTKRERGGTGLGLAITSSLVRAHGGRLTFSSEPKSGTRAVVTLPLGRKEGP